MSPVRTPGKRAQQAQRTRQKVVAAARELFISQGYGATTLQEIADRAGVSVQTIYFSFGNKGSVLKEVVDTSVAGDDEPVATMDRPWFREAIDQPSAAEQLEAHVHGTRRILDRVAPITEMVRTAALTNPDLLDLWERDANPRHVVQTAAAQALASKPDAVSDLSVAEIADRLYGVLSPELYLLLVRDRGWEPGDWESWALDTLRHQLCR
ncbi:TetR/AcrR family transcriptional regulator [Actinopolymorpha rutila]|uniref:AcrR family transcriptional regulator n=1 Tax=Actinopolymorpha rutila TaxID=446787 RepID=A0A852ZGV7_9ACTN|nr:TetR/AcrR family transcriptional regulator [Actinopolymorpha rutila]NYH88260.1 AcrR family transcriptional regulator [Actinopolymorpha rutila]